MKVLLVGDIIGKPGRQAVREILPRLRAEKTLDFCIANGENSAGGLGITPPLVDELIRYGADVITSGNHIFKKREILRFLETTQVLLRPANYPSGAPGRGEGLFTTPTGSPIAVLHLMGRVFMEAVDCPFQRAETLLGDLRRRAKVIIVDMHAEATSEKQAMGWFLDGKVSAVIGTHTHVQTSDERILPGGTAFMTDAGMTGPTESVIGMDKDTILKKFLTHVPQKFVVAGSGIEFQGVIVEVDPLSGKSTGIERVKIPLEGVVIRDDSQ